MLDLSWVAIAVCAVVVFVGAVVQASLGIGLGMIAAPVLAIVDPDFVPVAILVSVVPMSIAVAWMDRRDVEPRDVGFAVIGRVPGVIAGSAVVAAASDRLLAFIVAGAVLMAVVASIVGRVFQPTRLAIVLAGFGSGFTGTTAGIGGPPMALVYQHSRPTTMRATVSAFFAIGSILSLIALATAGQIGRRELALAGFMLPLVLVGTVCSRALYRRVDPKVVRPAVLAICLVSATILLVETF